MDGFITFLKKAVDVLIVVILIAVAASVIITYAAKTKSGSKTAQTSVFGYTPTVTLTGSMLPTIQINALSIVKCCDISEARTGDIIVYYSAERDMNIIHRAVEITGEGDSISIITKGDNNAAADSVPVTKSSFIGIAKVTFNRAAPVVEKLLREDGSGLDQGKLLIGAAAVFLAVLVAVELIKYLIILILKLFKSGHGE